MKIKIEKKDAHEGRNKPDKSSCLISKRRPESTLNRLNDELIRELDGSNFLELLPQDIMVNIFTKMRHCDLKHILLVSKLFNGAAIVARQTHFLFSTPSKKPVFRSADELSDSDVPNAPKASKPRRARQQKCRNFRSNDRRLMSLRLALFHSWATEESAQ